MSKPRINSRSRGFIMLYTALVVSLLLAVTASMASIAFKRTQLSITNEASQNAFYAAESGLECGIYWDRNEDAFEDNEVIECAGETPTVSTAPTSVWSFTIPFDNDTCADVTIDRRGANSVLVESRGYNNCGSGSRRFQRGVSARYSDSTSAGSGPADWVDQEFIVDSSGANDARELLDAGASTGDVYVIGPRLNVGNAPGAEKVITGIRFEDVDIPKSALISHAYVKFERRGTNGSTRIPEVRIEVQSDPANNVRFTDTDFDISSRPVYSESVTWNVPTWRYDNDESTSGTPNIRNLIQTAIDDPQWSTGDPITVIITFEADYGPRTAWSYEGDPDLAPSLHVVYE